MNIQQVMTADVTTVHPATTVEEIARIFIEQRISAVPVVDREQRVLGIVSQHDLFLKEKNVPFSLEKLPALFDEWIELEQLPQLYQSARHITAADIMTKHVVSADINSSIGDVARLMVQHSLKRLPIVENDRLAGMVTRADLIKLLLRAGQ